MNTLHASAIRATQDIKAGPAVVVAAPTEALSARRVDVALTKAWSEGTLDLDLAGSEDPETEEFELLSALS